MRRAVIDIGTNTTKVIIADVSDGEVVTVFSRDKTTRLGEGVNQTKRLLPAAIDRTARAIREFKAEAESHGATEIIALTTSASRDAVNRNEFFAAVRQVCGLEVQLISGDREAELIFRGVSSDPQWAGKPILVVDVGGGSAEFIQGCGPKMELFQSLPLGALRLTEKFGEGRYDDLCRELQVSLSSALADYDCRGRTMIATGGTITSLARVECGSIDHAVMARGNFAALLRRLDAMPLTKRKEVPGLPPERADIVVAGGAVLLVAMEVLGLEALAVSVRNLRYGALLTM